MINPRKEDIGRRVKYYGKHGPTESGSITSFNDEWVFVRYDGFHWSRATKRRNLFWTNDEKNPTNLLDLPGS